MNELLIFYFTGMILVALQIFMEGKPPIRRDKQPRLSYLISFIFWPVLIPFSFLYLWVLISKLSLDLSLWVCKKLKIEVEFPQLKN